MSTGEAPAARASPTSILGGWFPEASPTSILGGWFPEASPASILGGWFPEASPTSILVGVPGGQPCIHPGEGSRRPALHPSWGDSRTFPGPRGELGSADPPRPSDSNSGPARAQPKQGRVPSTQLAGEVGPRAGRPRGRF